MTEVVYRRFDARDRILHGLLMLSFLGLAATGLPLLFSDEFWAQRIARVAGSFEVAGWLHRVFAILLIGVFTTHLVRVGRRVARGDVGLLWGPRSMVPQRRDLTDAIAHVRWFVGLGPEPRFDRFTYWEKFDYWAVFWGMAVIGSSGLLLWFPELFSRWLPGEIFNIALLVHGEEALLAVGFIFTIHFFNTHLRPGKFPADLVIFTGRITASEFRHERPDEHDRLVARGQLEAWQADPAPEWVERTGRIVAAVAVTLGLTVVGAILYGVLR